MSDVINSSIFIWGVVRFYEGVVFRQLEELIGKDELVGVSLTRIYPIHNKLKLILIIHLQGRESSKRNCRCKFLIKCSCSLNF